MTNDSERRSAAQEGQAESDGYRQKVLLHLKEREQRMQEIERELLQVTFRLKECGVQRLARLGNVEKLLRGEKHRKQLHEERVRLNGLLEEARREVQSARERLEMIEEELREARDSDA